MMNENMIDVTANEPVESTVFDKSRADYKAYMSLIERAREIYELTKASGRDIDISTRVNDTDYRGYPYITVRFGSYRAEIGLKEEDADEN